MTEGVSLESDESGAKLMCRTISRSTRIPSLCMSRRFRIDGCMQDDSAEGLVYTDVMHSPYASLRSLYVQLS
jgi:hypothetical protein